MAIGQTISFYTQGCRLNQSETALLEERFEDFGYTVVPFQEPADIVVINTCTVTENGDSDARRLVNKVGRLNNNAAIALVGCMAQIKKEALLKWPNVRWVVGNAQKMDLPHIITTQEDVVITPKIGKESFTLPGISRDRHHTRANIKVQDGCDFYCAFCVIPFARGPARSREFDDIIKEATALGAAGHQELVITGVNIGTYAYKDYTFLDIIKEIEKISTIKRIRISSIEPTTIPEDLIYHMASSSKLCRHLHIPIQSGSDTILKGMSRKYTMKEFDDFIQFAYQTVPDICIGTDVIVGFPGETDALFNETEQYLRESPIHYFHVFSYSERDYARSKKLEAQVAAPDISQRSRILRDLSQRKRQLFQQSFIGRDLDVLLESEKDGVWTGLTDHYLRVSIPNKQLSKNTLVQVRPTEANATVLIAS